MSTVDATQDSGGEGYLMRKFLHESEDIGHGVRIRYFSAKHPVTDEQVRCGIFVQHLHDDGELCIGSVFLDTPGADRFTREPKWRVAQAEPLTISPSVHVTTCGLHGFIQGGKWVPA